VESGGRTQGLTGRARYFLSESSSSCVIEPSDPTVSTEEPLPVMLVMADGAAQRTAGNTHQTGAVSPTVLEEQLRRIWTGFKDIGLGIY